ncbi:titin-like isoform X2 [Wyeomyia smithii]|uniref:titin-like isoform X2 n=1 Tax=Wyeomyia smithii TaxID=174621 RepID=UPI002467CDC4|nr:titin-like isoform X2 [Wyeomyia smithii]
MERFAINILHKQIYKICRLCGVDNPIKYPIIDENETVIVGDDDEATLVRKIEECVGIQVSKDDRMPQNICSLCVDKINDFFEYRLMCAATNLQTRTILNLPLVDPTRKLIPVSDNKKIDLKEDVKKVVEAASTSGVSSTSSSKKGKKRRAASSPSPSPAPITRVKAAADIVKDEPVPVTPVKALTKKERLKQQQQIIQQKEKDDKKKKEDEKKKKEDDRKRKDEDKKKIKDEDKKKKDEVVESSSDPKITRSKRKETSPAREGDKVELSVPVPKKIKFEHPCSYCSDEFKTQTELDEHLGSKHIPIVRKFGCGSCGETFESILEFKDHNLWHQLTRTMYTCFKCKRKYDKNTALVKHCSLNACGRVSRGRPPTIKPDVQCRLCNKKFKTQNLYEWHSCFLKPKGNCPKCGKFFVKKAVLTRHYMMFCTGTLPISEPVVIPKEEPIDTTDKNATGVAAGAAAIAERRTRRSAVIEPELPKEEREIPFPPPLELAQDVAPSGSKKKVKSKETSKDSGEASSPALEPAKIASLLHSGAKLGRDTDIATINNLLSSVTEAIASLSEAKAKKKKKRKDKNKEKERVEEEPAREETPRPLESPASVVTPVLDEKSEEERQAEALALEVCEMTLDQQLAFCAGKQPMVVLAKTQFKQECTEIDTEPSRLQEPVDEENSDDHSVDDNANDFSAFQEEDDDQSEQQILQTKEAQQDPEQDQKEEENETEESTASREPVAEEEDIPFPMPIKQELEEESHEEDKSPEPETSEPVTPIAPIVQQKEFLVDEQLAVKIKKEPGLEEELEPPVKRKRPKSRSSDPTEAVSQTSSPKPTIILKIKKEKGLLNASMEPSKDIRTILLDDDENADAVAVKSNKGTRVYKKPDILAVKIKQEKVDPAYDRQEQNVQLPLGVQIKQEPIDQSEQSFVNPEEDLAEENILAKPPKKKARSMKVQAKSSSPVIAFDGVRIKQEKSDISVQPTVQAGEKKKKSKIKINPFALLKQRMAAEAAAKSAAAIDVQPAKPVQSPSPLPVITNVVGNAPPAASSSSSKSSSPASVDETTETQRIVPIIARVTSIATEPAEEFPMPIKQESVDDEEEAEEDKQEEQANEQQMEDDFPMPIKEEAPDTVSEELTPHEEEEPEFPMPIKEEPTEAQSADSSESIEPQKELEEEDCPEKPMAETPEKVAEEEIDKHNGDCDDGDNLIKANKTDDENEPVSTPDSEKEDDLLNVKEVEDEYDQNSESRQFPEVNEVLSGEKESSVKDELELVKKVLEESLPVCEIGAIETGTTPSTSSSETLEKVETSQKPESNEFTEQVSGSEPTPSQSDFEELQNLLTEGLKPTDLNYASSSAVETTTNGSSAEGLEDELDSLLNNKLEEISDQLKHPQDSASAATAPDEDISLAFERELLHEMMPLQQKRQNDGRTDAQTTEVSSMSTLDSRLLDAEKNPQAGEGGPS